MALVPNSSFFVLLTCYCVKYGTQGTAVVVGPSENHLERDDDGFRIKSRSNEEGKFTSFSSTVSGLMVAEPAVGYSASKCKFNVTATSTELDLVDWIFSCGAKRTLSMGLHIRSFFSTSSRSDLSGTTP